MLVVGPGGGGWVEALTHPGERASKSRRMPEGEQAGGEEYCERLIDYINKRSFTGIAYAFSVSSTSGFIVKRELTGLFKDSTLKKLRVRATYTTRDFEEYIYNEDCRVGQRDYIISLLLTCVENLSLMELSDKQVEEIASTSKGWQDVEPQSWSISCAVAKKLKNYGGKTRKQ